MTEDPHHGGVRPIVKSMSSAQRLVAIIGTSLLILALIVANAVLAVVCARHGDYERASVHMLAALAGVGMAFFVDFPQ